jgi:hypothetical protein
MSIGLTVDYGSVAHVASPYGKSLIDNELIVRKIREGRRFREPPLSRLL